MIPIRYTRNYKFTMDEQGDYYDVLRVNQNWAKLDALLGDIREKITNNVDANIQILAGRIIPTKTELTLLASDWKDANGLYTYDITINEILAGEQENRIELFPKVPIDTAYLEKLKKLNIVGAMQETGKLTLISSKKPDVDIEVILYIYASGYLIDDETSGEEDGNVGKELLELYKQIEAIKEDLANNYLSGAQIADVVERYDNIKSQV